MNLSLLRSYGAALLLACSLSSTGCVSHMVAYAFTDAPNGGRTAVDPQRPVLPIYDAAGRIDVPGPPAATLAYWIMEPGPARVRFYPEDVEPPAPTTETGWRHVDGNVRPGKGFFRIERGPIATDAKPRATVIVLHGWASRVRTTDTLWQLSATLADSGCRVILPDLRGHGDSTGQTVTSGHREVEDLSRLLDRVGDPDGPVGVIGHSYGGGIAIQFAAHDPRVDGVIGLAPLADIRPSMLPGVRGFAKESRPITWLFYLNWAINQQAIDKAQRLMEERTGADLTRNNALHQIRKIDVPVLILQGGQDKATPLSGAEKLRDANRDVVDLVVYPQAGHTSFLRDDFDDIQPRLRAWVDRLAATPPG